MTAATPERADEAMADVLDRMARQHERLLERDDPLRHYHGAALRGLRRVVASAGRGAFDDPAWILAFQSAAAERYLAPLERRKRTGAAPAVWERVYEVGDRSLPPTRHLLVGLLAARDYDAPLAMLDVLDDTGFGDAGTVSRHARDHVRLDETLRAATGEVLADLPGTSPPEPLARAVAKRLLTATRWGAWRNARLLSEARTDGRLHGRVYELESRVVDRLDLLAAPGPGLLRLARGVTVELPPWGRPD